VERLFGGDPDRSVHWQDMPARALNFLHGLLVLNPDKRLTATEALNHSWFKKPLSEATLLEERYEKVISFWRRRDDDEVFEKLPSRFQATQEDQTVTSVPKSRRKIPDSTLSPYFSLDRHLQPKIAPKRKIILETLNESGSPFLVTEQSQNKIRFANTATLMREFAGIETVKGTDVFEFFRSSQVTAQEESDLGEGCLVPATPHLFDIERTIGFDMNKTPKALLSSGEGSGVNTSHEGIGVGKRKRSRRELEDLEERIVRDGVAKALPRYSTAKVLRDAVEKKKQELKRKNLGGLVIRSSVPAA
jgi:hypothetical protein